MKGKYILPVISFIGASTLACVSHYTAPPDNSDRYKQEYLQHNYHPTKPQEPEKQQEPEQQSTPTAQQVPRTRVIPQRTLTVEEMLAVKQKIKTADAYTARNLPGNAYVMLLEAQEMAGGSFTDELNPRLRTTTSALKDFIDTYKVNVIVVDSTGSGRAEYVQYKLQDKQYKSGIEVVASGGYYSLTLDLRTLEVDEKRKTQSYVVQIPTGTSKSMNGEYAALQQRVDVTCADYFARRDAARGAGVQGVGAFAQAIDIARGSGGTNILGMAFSLAKTVDAGARLSAAGSANSQCQQMQEDLQGTPMFTSDTVTTPYKYEEKTTQKTATAGIRVSLTTNKGETIFSSPPLDIEFMREDVAREDIAAINVKGDPEESIDDKEVTRGVLQAIPDQVHTLTNQGGGLWDVIALQNAQKLSGEAALEAYVQLYFDAYQPQTKAVAGMYIEQNSTVTSGQLRSAD